MNKDQRQVTIHHSEVLWHGDAIYQVKKTSCLLCSLTDSSFNLIRCLGLLQRRRIYLILAITVTTPITPAECPHPSKNETLPHWLYSISKAQTCLTQQRIWPKPASLFASVLLPPRRFKKAETHVPSFASNRKTWRESLSFLFPFKLIKVYLAQL